jgi:SAM-dependent methyltransferase
MKILNYEDIKPRENIEELFLEVTGNGQLYKRLEEKYGEGVNTDTIHEQLRRLINIYGADFKQKSILDLGCGSTGGTYDFDMTKQDSFEHPSFTRTFEPWFCRALHELDVECLGVDYGNLTQEQFKKLDYTDLLDPSALDSIQDNSIDLANARLLFNSPQLEMMNGEGKLKEVLLPQLERIVKPDGLFFHC